MGRWKKLRSLKGFTTEIIDTNAITTKEFVKNLKIVLLPKSEKEAFLLKNFITKFIL